MSPNAFHDEDRRVLGREWNTNVIRRQITRNWNRVGTDRDLAEYDRWFDSESDDLDRILAASKRYGLKVVINMHSPPGGRYESRDVAIFHESMYQDHYVELWRKSCQDLRNCSAATTVIPRASLSETHRTFA